MALYAISDLHLPLGVDKPMNKFGAAWDNYVERLADNWQSVVGAGDTVVMPGDFSWATYLEQSERDFNFLNALNGRKILLKGNHDYWWTTMSRLNKFAAKLGLRNIFFLQNNSYMYENTALCGSRGWIHPAWEGFGAEDGKIFNRECARMELSLKSGAADAEEIIMFSHYPPRSAALEDNALTELIEKYGARRVVYGHLHGAAHRGALNGVYGSTEYSLVSADFLKFKPRLIIG